MNIIAFEVLKEKVMDFVKAQKGFDSQKPEAIDAFQEDKENVMVIYGENLWSGIAGIGLTVEAAYNDFIRSWKELNGFEWIEKNKNKNKR